MRRMLIRAYNLPDDTPFVRETGVFKTLGEYRRAVNVLEMEYGAFLKGAGIDPEKLVSKKTFDRVTKEFDRQLDTDVDNWLATGRTDFNFTPNDADKAIQPSVIENTRKYAMLKGWSEFVSKVSIIYAKNSKYCLGIGTNWPASYPNRHQQPTECPYTSHDC